MDKSIKKENIPILSAYVIWCSVLFFVFNLSDGVSWSLIIEEFKSINIKSSVLVVMMPLIIIVTNGLLSSETKAKIVFLRLEHSLPGHRVFSKYIKKDSRIDIDKLKDLVGDLPTDPIEQNKLWYRLYKKNENSSLIYESHKSFILTRDLAIFSLLFIIGSIIYFIIVKWNASSTKLILIYIVQLILLIISVNNYGKRFACNVIADFMKDA